MVFFPCLNGPTRWTACGSGTRVSSSLRRSSFAVSLFGGRWIRERSVVGCWMRLIVSLSGDMTSAPTIGMWAVSSARKPGINRSPRYCASPPPPSPTSRPRSLTTFVRELGIDLKVFDGGAQRTNLEFVVVQTTTGQKYADVHQIVAAHLPTDESGGAIVYCATRRRTEELADFLQAKGVKADCFHAGLPPETKKNVQESFIGGNLQAIVATNAFGMGIDKPDVRLVIHADVPGSLENYLQEAGRAGRDQQRRGVCCSTPRTTWSASSACRPVLGSPDGRYTVCYERCATWIERSVWAAKWRPLLARYSARTRTSRLPTRFPH